MWHPAPSKPKTINVGEVLKAYRKSQVPHITQAKLAELLNVDQSLISKIESGKQQVRALDFLLRLSERLDIDPRRLGLSPQLDALEPKHQELPHKSAIQTDQEHWIRVRKHMNSHRAELARIAATLHRDTIRLGPTLITKYEWLPEEPVDLHAINLSWTNEKIPCRVRGTEAEALRTCPLRSPGHQFQRYTLAIRALHPPSLFENRPSYRLVDINWKLPQLTFGLATYFDKLDFSEAVGHELATVALGNPAFDYISWDDLPFRSLAEDPFDFQQRAILPAITTLTFRRNRKHGKATFLLHWREPDKVATAGGLFDAIPAGEFQPSSLSPWDQINDLDIWRNIVREFSEEFLNNPEHSGNGSEPIDYEGWQLFRDLTAAQTNGRISSLCHGIGLDALTLAATILTTVVIDDEVFDEIFHDLVLRNSEGRLAAIGQNQYPMEGVPFTLDSITELLRNKPMASPGAACLELAWRNRQLILEHS